MGASAIGTSHLRTGLPCQDQFVCSIDDDILIIAVADGAGSASLSDLGAGVACRASIDFCRTALVDRDADLRQIVRDAFIVAHDRVLEKAQETTVRPQELATTLLLVIATKYGGAAGQVGDGLIAVKEADEGWSWVFWPQRGEYANTTRFITEKTSIEEIEVCTLPSGVAEIAAMTDGLEPLALHYASKALHDPFFEGFAQPLRAVEGFGEAGALSEKLLAFLESDRIRDRVDDDTTLVMTCRADP